MPGRDPQLSFEAIVRLAEREKGEAFIASFGRAVQVELAAVMAQERAAGVGLAPLSVDLRLATPAEEASLRADAEGLGLDPEEIVRWLLEEGERFRSLTLASPFAASTHEASHGAFLGWLESDYEGLRAWLERMAVRREERHARHWWKFWRKDEWSALILREWRVYRAQLEREHAEQAQRLADVIRTRSEQEYEEWERRLGELDTGLGREPTGALPLQPLSDAYAERGAQILERHGLKGHLCPALRAVSDDAFEIARAITPVAIGLGVAGAVPALAPAAVAALAIALSKVGPAVYCAEPKP